MDLDDGGFGWRNWVFGWGILVFLVKQDGKVRVAILLSLGCGLTIRLVAIPMCFWFSSPNIRYISFTGSWGYRPTLPLRLGHPLERETRARLGIKPSRRHE